MFGEAQVERRAAAATHRRVLQLVTGQAGRGRLLEAACGTGVLARELAARGLRVVAADLQAASFAAPEIPFLVCDLNRGLPFPPRVFDWVTCVEGIEHLEALSIFLAECARILRAGGRLLLTTPNLLNLASRVRFLLTGFSSLGIRPPREPSLGREPDLERAARDHISPLSYPLLRWRLRKSGFLIEKVTTDRRRLSASALLALWPACWWWTRAALAGERDGEQRETNREIEKHLMSADLLLGRTLMVLARKESGHPNKEAER